MKYGIEYYTEHYVDVYGYEANEQTVRDWLKRLANQYIDDYKEDNYIATEIDIDEDGSSAHLEFEREEDDDYFYIDLELVSNDGTGWIGLDGRKI